MRSCLTSDKALKYGEIQEEIKWFLTTTCVEIELAKERTKKTRVKLPCQALNVRQNDERNTYDRSLVGIAIF